MPIPDASSRRACCASLSPAPRPTASITTSSRRSTSRGRPTKAASACIGACSTRRAKFTWVGPVHDPDHWKVGGLAVLLGLLLSLPILARNAATAGEAVTLAIAANAVGAWFATVFAFWQTHYFVLGAAFALGLGVFLLIPLVVIALARTEEIATIAFGGR